MNENKLQSVRLSPMTGNGSEGVPVEEAVIMDLPLSNKFDITWPAESKSSYAPPPLSDYAGSRGPSSDEDSDTEEQEEPPIRNSAGHIDIRDIYATEMMVQPQIQSANTDMFQVGPRMSRAISMPLPSQLEPFQNPRRINPSPSASSASPLPDHPRESSQFQDLSLELADSVQMMIQTLLQVSPTQILDPTKELFSACSLSVPTPSMSALFTLMKNLNYISANMAEFCTDTTSAATLSSTPVSEFDIGEMLQSVGDALSGAAAHAGVDLVIFHADVGMKHVSVIGDENALSYALTHIVRQILSTARNGDSLELGLYTAPATAKPPRTSGGEPPAPDNVNLTDIEWPLECTVEISHKFASVDLPETAGEAIPDPTQPTRPRPALDTLILRRLLAQLDGSLESDLVPKLFPFGTTYEFSVTLNQGLTPTHNPLFLETSEESATAEPSLHTLKEFAESLKGRKATFYASSKGSFAHHLSSYLTAWGMDVSHISSESGSEGSTELRDDKESQSMSSSVNLVDGYPPQGLQVSPEYVADSKSSEILTPSFDIIDDDVVVLRNRLQKLRQDHYEQIPPPSRKRPSLAAHHRPKSSPQITRAMGAAYSLPSPSPPVIVVHFTSLSNFKYAKNTIQTAIASYVGSPAPIPEVMIIPKPVGPRRFLTALHTAVTKPIVDPFFAPIATSPLSPAIYSSSFFSAVRSNSPSPSSPHYRPTNVTRTNSERSGRSPKEHPAESSHPLLPSPLGLPDNGVEYFSEAAVRLGTSPSSGLVIQSPDGQPAGIYFHPRGKGTKSTPSPSLERDRGQLRIPSEKGKILSSRRTSDVEERRQNVSFAALHATASSRLPTTPLDGKIIRDPQISAPNTPKPRARYPATPQTEEEQYPLSNSQPSLPAASRRTTPDSAIRRLSSPPRSPLGDISSGSTPRRAVSRRPTAEVKLQSTAPIQKAGIAGGTTIVPPISVLVVDDNPINRTILTTFLKKKKIKFDIATNGQEAVEKWQTGDFHLILMDIQMPIMDGITATKEIRRMEKLKAGTTYPPTPRLEDLRSPIRSPSERPASSPYRSSVIIVALTASSLQSDRVAALAAGCNDFLTKPVSLVWLNSKIIEWGSIKALQMWADLRPDVVQSITNDQVAQAKNVAQKLHVPENRRTPAVSPSRKTSRSDLSELARSSDSEMPTSTLPDQTTLPSLSPDTGSSGSADIPSGSLPQSGAVPPAPE